MSRHTRSKGSRSAQAAARRQRKAQAARRLWIGAGVVGVLLAVVLLVRPGARLPAELSAAQAYAKYLNGVFVLDVRGEADWNAGHIPRSVLIPLEELSGRLGELPQDGEIVVVCRAGVRSKQGAEVLVEAGFWPVACLDGGLQAWVDAGYPLERTGP